MSLKNSDSAASIAFQEISSIIESGALLSAQYFPWLNKWQDLYSTFELPPLFGTEGDFHTIYWHLDQLKTYLSFTAEAEEALLTFENIKDEDEMALLKWLTKHEFMHKELGLFIYNTMCANLNENIKIIDVGKIKLKSIEFMPLIKYCNVYYPLYFEMLNKYSTYTSEEESKIDYNGEEGDEYLSLTFQLKKSGIIN